MTHDVDDRKAGRAGAARGARPRRRCRLGAGLLVLAWAGVPGLGHAEEAAAPPALVQPAAPAVRQIAPGFIPLYNLSDPADPAGSGRPSFEIALPTGERPLGGCDRSLSRALFNRCLGVTVEFSRRTLEATVVAAQKTIEAREDLPAGHRARWSRLLDAVHASWKEARNLECGQLIFLERGPKANVFEERAQCLLAADRERIADLRRRYGLD